MSWNPDIFDDSEDDETEYYEDFSSGREAIIFLVDAILSRNKELFQECLNIIQKAILNGILIKEKDLIGVVFCNTEHKPDPKDIDGIKNIVIKENTAVLLPLRSLTKDIVSYYLDFSAADTDHFDFENRYGCKVGSFANAIWLCTNMFKQCGTKLISSNIIMFTDRDIPPDVEAGDFQKAIQKASDLREIEIDFNVIPMIDNFDYEKFYKEFICTVRDIDLDQFILPDPKDERQFVKDRQLRQNFKKQCNARLKWTISDGLEISIAIYNYYRKNIYPKSVKLLRENNSVVDVKYVLKIASINDEDEPEERLCMPGDERKVIKVGGQKIIFTNDELAKMRSPLTPCLRLLGFKPRDIISIHNFIKSTSFLYPDENVIEGSTKLFRALWEKCIEKEKIAICVLVSRRKSPPRYVALVPTTISVPENQTKIEIDDYIQKDGFKIVYLPFEIDYRDIDISEWNLPDDEIDDSKVELFQKIIKKLKYKFSPTKTYDPTLKKLRTDILGLALDVEPEDEDEDLMIDVNKQDERIKSYTDNLKDLFGEDIEETKKRKPADRSEESATGRQQKVPKITEDDVTEEQITRLIATKNLNQLTVKQLKTYLQNKNVKGISSATKTSLIEKVIDLHL